MNIKEIVEMARKLPHASRVALVEKWASRIEDFKKQADLKAEAHLPEEASAMLKQAEFYTRCSEQTQPIIKLLKYESNKEKGIQD